MWEQTGFTNLFDYAFYKRSDCREPTFKPLLSMKVKLDVLDAFILTSGHSKVVASLGGAAHLAETNNSRTSLIQLVDKGANSGHLWFLRVLFLP